MKISDEELERLAKQFTGYRMLKTLSITFYQYLCEPEKYDAMIAKVAKEKTHGINITFAKATVVAV